VKNMGIRAKLLLSIGSLAFGYLIFWGLIQWTGNTMQTHLRTASESLFPAALASQEAEAGFQKLTKDYKDAVLMQDASALALADADARKVSAQLQAVRDKTAGNADLQQEVSRIQSDFKSLNSRLKASYSQMISAAAATPPVTPTAGAATLAAVAPAADPGQLQITVKELVEESAHMGDALKDLNDQIGSRDFQAELTGVGTAIHRQRNQTLVLLVFAVAFATLTTWILQRQISIPLGHAVEALRHMANGDLTATLDVHTGDEVGRMAAALNEALDKMRATLREVGESATNASASAQQLAGTAESIAGGSQKQAASLEETSASLEEITATVRQNAHNAKQASQLASGSKDADRTRDALNAVAAMEDINVASAKISDIISTIDEIAFQTNLLAVNAAVEAARAGEEGRGFAVVASEVRSLAQRSAGAAKEIKALIQDSLRKVEKGTELVHRVTHLVGEIASASEEQSTGIEQVNLAMTEMDRVAQSNASQTEELSSTAQSLSQQSARLTELIGTFKVDRRARRNRSDSQNLKPRGERGDRNERGERGGPAQSAIEVRRTSPEVRSVVASMARATKPYESNADKAPTVVTLSPNGVVDDASFEEF